MQCAQGDKYRIGTGVDTVGETAAEFGGTGRRRGEGTLAKLVALVREGQVDPHVVRTYPLVEAAQALVEVETGHAGGKIVLLP